MTAPGPSVRPAEGSIKAGLVNGDETIGNKVMGDVLLLDLRAPQALCFEVPPNISHLAVRPEMKVVFALNAHL